MMDFTPIDLDTLEPVGAPDQTKTSALPPTPPRQAVPEAAPSLAPAPAPQRRSQPLAVEPSPFDQPADDMGGGYGSRTDLLPQAYREGRKNIYKKRSAPDFQPVNLDTMEFGGDGPIIGAPRYNPEGDYSWTRGFKVAAEGGEQSIGVIGDMAKIAALPADQQAAAMLKLANTPVDPRAARLQVGSMGDIGSKNGYISDTLTFIGESLGQMVGSMYAAAETGGAAGAVTGAAVGGAGGALAGGGVGAIPGAVAGGITGAGWGILGAYGAMGVGGMFNDLLADPGVQKGLQDGTVTPQQIMAWSLAAGAAIGGLDVIPGMKALRKASGGDILEGMTKQTIKKAVLHGILKTGAEEGVTEGIQGAISELGQAIVGGDVKAAQRILSVLDQAVAGGIGGGPVGGVAGLMENSKLPEQAAPQSAAGTSSPLPPSNQGPPGAGGAGVSGPGTGTSTTPTPPAGTRPTAGTDATKIPVGTPVTQTLNGVDPAASAALGGQSTEASVGSVDPDAAAALGTSVAPAGTAVAPRVENAMPLTPEAQQAPQGATGAPPATYYHDDFEVTHPAQPLAPPPTRPAVEMSPELRYPSTLRPGEMTTPGVAEAPVTPAPTEITPALRDEVADVPREQWAKPLGTKRAGPRGWLTEQKRQVVERQLAAAEQRRVEKLTAEQRKETEQLRQERGTARASHGTDLVDARARLNQYADAGNRVYYEHFWNNLHPELRNALPQSFRPARRFLRIGRTAAEQAAAPQRQPVEGPSRAHLALPPPIPEGAGRPPSSVVPGTRKLEGRPEQPAGIKRFRLHRGDPTGAEVRHPKTRKRLGRVESVADGQATVSFRKTPIPVEDLLKNYVVETGAKVTAAPELAKAPIYSAPKSTEVVSAPEPEARKRVVPGFQPSKRPLKSFKAKRVPVSTPSAVGESDLERPGLRVRQTTTDRRSATVEVPEHTEAGRHENVPGRRAGRTMEAWFRKPVEERTAKDWQVILESVRDEFTERQQAQKEIDARLADKEAKARIKGGARVLPETTGEWAKRVQEMLDDRSLSLDARAKAAEDEANARYEAIQARETEEEKRKVRRHGKKTRKDYASMAGEDPSATFRIAQRAYKNSKGAVKPRPVDRLDAIEWDMGEMQQFIADAGRSKAAEPTRQSFRDILAKLEKARLKEALRREQKATKDRELKDKKIAEERAVYQAHIEKLVADGKIDADRGEDIRLAYNSSFKYKALKQREEHTGPVIKEALKKFGRPKSVREPEARAKPISKTNPNWRRPKGATDPETRRSTESWSDIYARRLKELKGTTALQRAKERAKLTPSKDFTDNQLVKWANDFVGYIETELKKDGHSLPRTTDKNDNSVLENLVLYTRKALRQPMLSKRRNDLIDAWGAVEMFQRLEYTHARDASGKIVALKPEDLFLENVNKRDQLYGMMFAADMAPGNVADSLIANSAEVAQLKAEQAMSISQAQATAIANGNIDEVVAEVAGVTADMTEHEAAIAEAQAEAEIYQTLANAGTDTAMAAAAQMAVRRKRAALRKEADRLLRGDAEMLGWDVADTSVGPDRETLTGREAISRFLKKGRDLNGGVRGKLRDAIVASLERLVGDVPVHIVSAGEMQRLREGREGNAAGLYRHGDHAIYLQRYAAENPRMAADILTHELIHAATYHAIEHNLKGLGDILEGIRQRARLAIPKGNERIDYYLSKHHEFITGAMESGEFQDLLDNIDIGRETRADLRALARGKEKATLWDHLMAWFENLVGVLTPGRYPKSYMDAMLRFYDRAAMSTQEQMADMSARGFEPWQSDGNRAVEMPFNVAAYTNIFQQAASAQRFKKGRGWLSDVGRGAKRGYLKYFASTEEIRKDAAEQFFGHDFDNPISDLANAHLELQRLVEDAKRPGDEKSAAVMQWVHAGDYVSRFAHLGEAMRILLEGSVKRLDPRKDENNQPNIYDDRKQPGYNPKVSKSIRHQMEQAKRPLAERLHQAWQSVDPELARLLSDRADYMSQQMADYKKDAISRLLTMLMNQSYNPVKLGFMKFDTAVNQIYSGKVSDYLRQQLGDHYERLMEPVSWYQEDQLYMPTHREGEFFISAHRDIDVPAGATVDQKALDERDVFKLKFNSISAANDYVREQGKDPEGENVLNQGIEYYDAAGNKVSVKDPGALPKWTVTVQHRYMEMGNSIYELNKRREQLTADGYTDIRAPISLQKHRQIDPGMMPQQLERALDAIDNMKGFSEGEKSLAKSMITNNYVREQQGSRIGKKMLRRQGVEGYSTDTASMMESLDQNNEMMSRHKVAAERIPRITEATKKARDFVNAASSPTRRQIVSKLDPKWQTMVTRDYADDPSRATRLSEIVDEMVSRINDAMRPNDPPGMLGALLPEGLRNSALSVIMMSYLFRPVYFGIQLLGLPMQTWPAMVAEFSRTEGAGAATTAHRYLTRGLRRVGGKRNLSRSLREAGAEGKQFAEGLAPRQGYLEHGRHLRRSHDYVEEVIQRLLADPDLNPSYKPHMEEMIRRARLRNHVGQAGLDQPNLQFNELGSGFWKKAGRGIEQSARIFRALQEGLEINNRMAPMVGYLEFYLDKLGPNATEAQVNQAIEKSINNMAREQVGYSKANWPSLMGRWWARFPFMFKKFAMQQAMNYYGAISRAITSTPPPEEVIQQGPDAVRAWHSTNRRAAIAHALAISAMLVLVGGASGLPVWEPIRLLAYLLGLSENWDDTKTKGESWMADFVGPEIAESVMYGLPRMVGIDLSSRVAQDSLLFYQQPKEMTAESWFAVVGQMAGGAPMSTAVNLGRTVYGLGGDQPWAKWVTGLPIPAAAKDVLNTYTAMTGGRTTSTGVHTGPPPAMGEAILEGLGIRTRSQARPFEQGSAAQQRSKQIASRDKTALVQRVLNQGMTGANAAKIRAWNESHEVKDRITTKSISIARKRRTKMEREMQSQNEAAVEAQ